MPPKDIKVKKSGTMPPNKGPTPKRQRPKFIRLVECKVCQDRANDHNHYGSQSCYSCRAFFRRAITRKVRYECTKNGCCVINKDTRKSCQACRLQACFAIGMKEEMVMTEEEKRDKKRRADEKKKPDASIPDDEAEAGPSQVLSNPVPPPPRAPPARSRSASSGPFLNYIARRNQCLPKKKRGSRNGTKSDQQENNEDIPHPHSRPRISRPNSQIDRISSHEFDFNDRSTSTNGETSRNDYSGSHHSLPDDENDSDDFYEPNEKSSPAVSPIPATIEDDENNFAKLFSDNSDQTLLMPGTPICFDDLAHLQTLSPNSTLMIDTSLSVRSNSPVDNLKLSSNANRLLSSHVNNRMKMSPDSIALQSGNSFQLSPNAANRFLPLKNDNSLLSLNAANSLLSLNAANSLLSLQNDKSLLSLQTANSLLSPSAATSYLSPQNANNLQLSPNVADSLQFSPNAAYSFSPSQNSNSLLSPNGNSMQLSPNAANSFSSSQNAISLMSPNGNSLQLSPNASNGFSSSQNSISLMSPHGNSLQLSPNATNSFLSQHRNSLQLSPIAANNFLSSPNASTLHLSPNPSPHGSDSMIVSPNAVTAYSSYKAEPLFDDGFKIKQEMVGSPYSPSLAMSYNRQEIKQERIKRESGFSYDSLMNENHNGQINSYHGESVSTPMVQDNYPLSNLGEGTFSSFTSKMFHTFENIQHHRQQQQQLKQQQQQHQQRQQVRQVSMYRNRRCEETYIPGRNPPQGQVQPVQGPSRDLFDDILSLEEMSEDKPLPELTFELGASFDQVWNTIPSSSANMLRSQLVFSKELSMPFTIEENMQLKRLLTLEKESREVIQVNQNTMAGIFESIKTGGPLTCDVAREGHNTCVKRLEHFISNLSDFGAFDFQDKQAMLSKNVHMAVNIKAARLLRPGNSLQCQIEFTTHSTYQGLDPNHVAAMQKLTTKLEYHQVFSSPWCCNIKDEVRFLALMKDIFQLEMDDVTHILLTSASLFATTSKSGVRDCEVATKIKDSFVNLLYRYLCNQIGRVNANNIFPKYQKMLSQLREMTEIMGEKRLNL